MRVVPHGSGQAVHTPSALLLCAHIANCDRIAFWIGQAGWRAIEAKDGYQAAQWLRTGAIDILLTDRLLPPWPGLDLYALRKQLAIPIINICDGESDNSALARTAGATRILDTPLRRFAVLDAVMIEEAA